MLLYMENKEFLIDSNIFIAFWSETEELHEKAKNILMDINNRTIVIHPYIIAETTTVLSYKYGIEKSKDFLKYITTASNVKILPVSISFDIDLYSKNNKKISFIDMTLIGLAKEYGYVLVTFDKQMIKVSKF